MLVWLIPTLTFLVGLLIGAGFAVHNVNKTTKMIEQLQKESTEKWWSTVHSIENELKKLETKVLNKTDKKVN